MRAKKKAKKVLTKVDPEKLKQETDKLGQLVTDAKEEVVAAEENHTHAKGVAEGFLRKYASEAQRSNASIYLDGQQYRVMLVTVTPAPKISLEAVKQHLPGAVVRKLVSTVTTEVVDEKELLRMAEKQWIDEETLRKIIVQPPVREHIRVSEVPK